MLDLVLEACLLYRLLLQLDQAGVNIDFGGIGEVSDSRLVGEHWLVAFVHFLDAGTVVDLHLVEDDVVEDVFFLGFAAGHVLRLDLDPVALEFLDDLLYVHLQEAVEGGDLLGDESVLLEVGPDHGPGVFLVDFRSKAVELGQRVDVLWLFRVQHF